MVRGVAQDRANFAVRICDGDLKRAKKYLAMDGLYCNDEMWDKAYQSWRERYRKDEVRKEREKNNWVTLVVVGKGNLKIRVKGKECYHD